MFWFRNYHVTYVYVLMLLLLRLSNDDTKQRNYVLTVDSNGEQIRHVRTYAELVYPRISLPLISSQNAHKRCLQYSNSKFPLIII